MPPISFSLLRTFNGNIVEMLNFRKENLMISLSNNALGFKKIFYFFNILIWSKYNNLMMDWRMFYYKKTPGEKERL